MFDHVTIRVGDLEEARSFYGLAMSTLGFGELETDEWWDFSLSAAGEDRTVTRNLHVAFVAPSAALVDEWWETMTAAGYRDDGAPGLRPEYHSDYYGAFVRDPDGNSIEAVRRRGELGDNHIDHLWLRAADPDASRRFYETVATILGFEVDRSEHDARIHVAGPDRSFTLVRGEPPTENVHIAFPARDNDQVDEFHRAALAAGYRDNGAPGERGYHPGYYGAFVLDPDGNNFEAVCHNR